MDVDDELNPDYLARYIRANGLKAEIVFFEAETPTVEIAAKVAKVLPEQICKSILFIALEEPIIVISTGIKPIGYKMLADQLGISRRKLKLAKPGEVLRITGYRVGTVPPFGHRVVIPTYIENQALDQSELYAGGGAENALLRITPEELKAATSGILIDL